MDKKQINETVRDYLFATAMTMFRYDGLPDNVRPEDLERMLLENGELIFTKWRNEFYIFQFTGAGKQNYLGEWDSYQVNNPYINCNQIFTDKDAVRVRNTDNSVSLAGMLDMYSELLSESYITLNMSDVNARLSFLISAGDSATKASAELFLKQVYDGKQGIIGSQPLLDSLSVNPLAEHRDFQSVIELNKFYYSDFFQKIGLTNLYNNIHDRISATETEFTATSIYPFVDNMLKNRKKAVEKINELFGLNVTVEFTSSWDYRLMNGKNLTQDDFRNSDLFGTGSSDQAGVPEEPAGAPEEQAGAPEEQAGAPEEPEAASEPEAMNKEPEKPEEPEAVDKEPEDDKERENENNK